MPTAYILKDGKPLKYTADPLGEGAMKFRVGAKYPLPEGGLYSTATDLFILYQMMLNRGQYNGVRILSPASVDAMTRVHTGDLATNAPGNGYGLGWVVAKDSAALTPVGSYGHGGALWHVLLHRPLKRHDRDFSDSPRRGKQRAQCVRIDGRRFRPGLRRTTRTRPRITHTGNGTFACSPVAESLPVALSIRNTTRFPVS